MQKGGVRARISHKFENGLVEILKKDLEELGLKILVETKTAFMVIATKEQWASLGVEIQEQRFGNQCYYQQVNSQYVPECLQKYENLTLRFLNPTICCGGL